MITLTSINISFRGKKTGESVTVAENFNLEIKKGEIVSILGPSGCGKSTLLRVISGILSPNSGVILVDGQLPEQLKKNKKIGIVFQEPYLINWQTVRQNILFPLDIGKQDSNNTTNENEIVERLLNITKLKNWKDAYPKELSVGMRQRVSVARSLVLNPSIILLDEPFSALDDFTRLSLCQEVYTLIRQTGATVLLVTHNIEEAFFFSDRVILLSPKPIQVIQEYKVDWGKERELDLFNNPAFLEKVSKCKKLVLQPN